jgi:hypothetical protein
MTTVVYDKSKELPPMKKTCVKITYFQLLPDMEANMRYSIEEIAARGEKNGIKAVAWHKMPVKINDMEYNASLVKTYSAFDVEPDKKDDDASLKALEEISKVRKGKAAVRVDVVSPFIIRNVLNYIPQW